MYRDASVGSTISDVLFTRLHLKTGARRPIADAYDDMGRAGGVLRQVERVDNGVERISSLRSTDPPIFASAIRRATACRSADPISLLAREPLATIRRPVTTDIAARQQN